MKKLSIVIVFLAAICMTGCKEYGEKRIVTLLLADKEKIAVYYYDFSAEKPTYLKEEKVNNGIKNTLIELLAENDYDLKLCKYAVVSEDVIKNDINELFFALTDARFAPDIVILQGDTEADAEKYMELEKDNYPIYDYNFDNGLIDAAVEMADSDEKNIIIDNNLYKKINDRQSFVLDMLCNKVKGGEYIFQQGNKNLSANLDRINTYYSVKNGVLKISITAVVKSYKGLPSDKKYKQQLSDLLKTDIKSNAESLLKDSLIAENLNLLWFRQVKEFSKIKVETNIL